MVTLTLNLNPDLESDIEQARALLERLSAAHVEAVVKPDVLREKIIALLRGYGQKRTDYIRHVAQASPRQAPHSELIEIVGSAKAVGGTHSAIERAWRAKGMTTPFITTDPIGDAYMDLDLADIVLSVLHDQIDEPDPLSSARF